MLPRTTTLALAALMTLSAAPAALAQVDDAMLNQLKAVMAEQGTPIEWESVQTYDNSDGDEVTALINAKVKVGEETVTLNNLELSNVTKEAGGGYKIGTVALPQQRFEEGDTVVDLADVTVEGLVLPAEGQPAPDVTMYDSAGVGTMEVRVKDKDVFSMSDFHVELTPAAAGGPMAFSGAAEAFSADLSGIEDPATKAVLTKMGYEKLEGFFELEGSWDMAGGNLAISQYDITVNDAGTFGIALELGGYTPELLKQLRQMQEQMAANPNQDNSAQGLAMLGLLQQLTFKSARVDFSDDSLTGKVLDYVAAQQNSKPAAIANQAKAVVPFLTMQLNDAEFTQMATKAVSDYLDNPQNFAIVAAPASPVPFALIVASAMTAPQSLIKQLGVSILANE